MISPIKCIFFTEIPPRPRNLVTVSHMLRALNSLWTFTNGHDSTTVWKLLPLPSKSMVGDACVFAPISMMSRRTARGTCDVASVMTCHVWHECSPSGMGDLDLEGLGCMQLNWYKTLHLSPPPQTKVNNAFLVGKFGDENVKNSFECSFAMAAKSNELRLHTPTVVRSLPVLFIRFRT